MTRETIGLGGVRPCNHHDLDQVSDVSFREKACLGCRMVHRQDGRCNYEKSGVKKIGLVFAFRAYEWLLVGSAKLCRNIEDPIKREAMKAEKCG